MGRSPRPQPANAEPRVATAQAPAQSSSASSLLDAMKEELFQLELERQQGKISEDEYKQAKAALDQTLQRALARSRNA